MLISEKNFLERLAARLPGIGGYREREGRRETDRRLREWLAGRLDEGASDLDPLRNAITRGGRLDAMNDLGELDRTIKKTAAALRFADAGYGGLFDAVKIREDELAAIYAFDLSLLESVETLALRLHALATGSPPGAEAETELTAILADARRLDHAVGRRRELFEKPEPAGPARGE
jgi:hypothetical protein